MKKMLTLLFTVSLALSTLQGNVFAGGMTNAEMMSVSSSFSDYQIEQGDSFTLTVTVNNATYKETYESGDPKLTNPGVDVNFSEYSSYLIPETTTWTLPLSSMENTGSQTFTKTFDTEQDIPTGTLLIAVNSWTDKSNSDTLDHETQGSHMEILTSSNPPPSEPVEPVTPQEEPEPVAQEEELPEITLPGSLIEENSSTTRIDEMTCDELNALDGFTLETLDKNKIAFSGSFELCEDKIIEKLNKLSEYIDLSLTGKVSIDTDYLDFFVSKATVTMYGLSFAETPLIYKDGKLASTSEVSNINYSKVDGTLTFDVESFSIYEARSKDSKDSASMTAGSNPVSKDFLFILLFLIFVITGIGIGGSVIYKKKVQPKSKQDKKDTPKEKKSDSKEKERSEVK